MITTPPEDLGLDEKHARQLEVGLQKLSNVEAEISISNRNLRVIKDDVVKATLELKELEEKVAVAESLLSEKNAEKDRVTALVAEATEALKKANESAREIVFIHEAKGKELGEREEAVAVAERTIVASQEKNAIDRIAVEKDQADIEKVKDTFGAITLPWK